MRLVHLADLHLGYRQYQRCTTGGINQREADVAATLLRAITQVIELEPDVVVIAGDIFHAVRPSNPAILHAYRMFARLREALPEVPIVVVAGNHDAPRTQEAGCILRLFREIGIHVADTKAELFTFPSRDLAILAVPDVLGMDTPPLEPPAGFGKSVLVLHGEIAGALPPFASRADRATIEIRPEDLHAEKWSYIALGHYHVYQQVAPRAYYCGSLEYTSNNTWGELREEVTHGINGKGFIEHDLVTHRHRFHPVQQSRMLLDLEPIDATGMTAAEVDNTIRMRVDATAGGIEDKIVRLLLRNIHRHTVRELDHSAIREYKRRALHFQLDTRKPEPIARRGGDGAPGRRATLPEIVAERLQERVLSAGIDREQFVTLGLKYLRDAEDALTAAMPVMES